MLEQGDDLVGANVFSCRHRAIFDHHKISNVLHTRHKPDALIGERFKAVVVGIGAIINDDGAGANRSSRATRISWVLPSVRTAKLGR